MMQGLKIQQRGGGRSADKNQNQAESQQSGSKASAQDTAKSTSQTSTVTDQMSNKDKERHRGDRDRRNKPRDRERRPSKEDRKPREPATPPAPTILKIASKSNPPDAPISGSPVPSATTPVKILSTPEHQREQNLAPKFKPFESVKLINEHLEFCLDTAGKMLVDQTDFTVVGVLGPQGVGKSSLFSELCGYSLEEEEVPPPFAPQSEECYLSARHQTSGIDMCVSADKFILLDVQPIMSPSILAHMIKNETKVPLTAEVVSYENLHELQSIQLGVFLLSVCHVVIVMQDWVTDVQLWNYLRTIEMLKFSIPDMSMMSSGVGENQIVENEFIPDVVFVFNKTQDQHFSPERVLSLQNLIDKLCPPSFKTKDLFFIDPLLLPKEEDSKKNLTSSKPKEIESEKHANIFLLPMNENLFENPDEINVFNETYTTLSRDIGKKILAMKKRNFQRLVSERDWLRGASKAWDMIRRSSTINEYNRTLQKMGLYRT